MTDKQEHNLFWRMAHEPPFDANDSAHDAPPDATARIAALESEVKALKADLIQERAERFTQSNGPEGLKERIAALEKTYMMHLDEIMALRARVEALEKPFGDWIVKHQD